MNTNWQARCAAIDNDASRNFENLMTMRGFKWRKATLDEEINHIDYVACHGLQWFKFELKGFKRGVEDGLFLIELRNVQGKRGWLYGDADYIVFHLGGEKFKIIERRKLVDTMKKLFGFGWDDTGFTRTGKGKQVEDKFPMAPDFRARDDRPMEVVTYVRAWVLD